MPKPNELPRPRVALPDAWDQQVERLNPLHPDGWVCLDDSCQIFNDKRQSLPMHCPLCFRSATQLCGRCGSVYYCSKECQKMHWRHSHKQACSPNPKLYVMDVSLNVFRSLDSSFFEPFEFILIKPTGRVGSLSDICEQVLDSAEDLMEISGFGHNQIQPLWASQNQSSHIARDIRRKLGYEIEHGGSGIYAIEPVEGYRAAEDICMTWVICDDNFIGQEKLPSNYYGGAMITDPVRKGKSARGNFVIFRTVLKNKKRIPAMDPIAAIAVALTDDTDLAFEYEMYPMCKAEIAHMLQERRIAIDNGAYTRRMWRAHNRQRERAIEAEAKFGNIIL